MKDNINENSRYTILVVEDEANTRKGIEQFLESAGYKVIAAKNGQEALDHFRDAALVILDIMMPELDGIEVLKNIRKTSNMPVIMLTALSDERTQLTTFNEPSIDIIGSSKAG